MRRGTWCENVCGNTYAVKVLGLSAAGCVLSSFNDLLSSLNVIWRWSGYEICHLFNFKWPGSMVLPSDTTVSLLYPKMSNQPAPYASKNTTDKTVLNLKYPRKRTIKIHQPRRWQEKQWWKHYMNIQWAALHILKKKIYYPSILKIILHIQRQLTEILKNLITHRIWDLLNTVSNKEMK